MQNPGSVKNLVFLLLKLWQTVLDKLDSPKGVLSRVSFISLPSLFSVLLIGRNSGTKFLQMAGGVIIQPCEAYFNEVPHPAIINFKEN